MRFEILFLDECLEVKTFGDAELNVFKDMTLAILSDQYWHPGQAILINHSELNTAPLATDELLELAVFNQQFNTKIGQAKIAILVARDLEFGLSRMWQVFSSEERESATKIFKDREEALFWLKGSGFNK